MLKIMAVEQQFRLPSLDHFLLFSMLKSMLSKIAVYNFISGGMDPRPYNYEFRKPRLNNRT